MHTTRLLIGCQPQARSWWKMRGAGEVGGAGGCSGVKPNETSGNSATLIYWLVVWLPSILFSHILGF